MRTRVLAVMLSTIALLSACGGNSGPAAQAPVEPAGPVEPTGESPAAPPASSGGSVELEGSPAVEKIKQRGKLMVGLPADDSTLATRDETGNHGGFDVEMARVLAAGLGLNPQTQVTFRVLPPTLRADAMASGNVDVQLGGFDPAAARAATVGPYVIIGPPGHEVEQFVGLKPGDDAMRTQLQQVLDKAVADGSWQRAYDATLGRSGVAAHPPH